MARIFTRGGWWAVVVPVGILGVLFVAVLRAPSEQAPSLEASPATVFVPSFERLPPVPLGHYELWVQQPDGGSHRLGAFTVLPGGSLVSLSGEPLGDIAVAELPPVDSLLLLTVVSGSELSIERPDRVLLRGTLAATEVRFEAAVPAATGTHRAMLLAPTDAKAPDTSGVWFAAPSTVRGKPRAGLALSAPPPGWAYGGFVTTAAGTVLPTGAFVHPAARDQSAAFSGTANALAFPGEDFVRHAPEHVTFPLNLADGRTTLSVSLLPDFAPESAAPFVSLLTARIPYQQKTGEGFPLEAVSPETFPGGTGVFEQRERADDGMSGTQ